jgi:hypothetical protein
MADRFRSFSKGVNLSPCVLFDVITHTSGPNEGHPRRIVFVHPGEKCVCDCRFSRITFSTGGKIGRFSLIS